MQWRRKWQPTPVFLPGEPQTLQTHECEKHLKAFFLEICASGFKELLESIFCLLLVEEVFSLQEVFEMHEEVVIGERSGEYGCCC